jgi:hypothetical protein
MDQSVSPSSARDLYAGYLPFAIALEVEQSWGDALLATSASLPESDFWEGTPRIQVSQGDSAAYLTLLKLQQSPRQ